MTLSSLLILAVCRTRNGPCSPEVLFGSVVEHRSSESESLRLDSSSGLRIFLCLTLVTSRKTSFSKCKVSKELLVAVSNTR